MLELEINPERSIGTEYWEFILRMPLNQAISLLKSQDNIIKNVYFCYCDQDLLSHDLIINLTQDGIRFIFDSLEQRLKIIEVYNMSKVKLKYCGEFFNSSSVQPTITQIDQCFGATHPAEYNADRTMLLLNFRGLSFNFKIDSKYELPTLNKYSTIEYPPALSPIATSLYIFSGHSPLTYILPPLPISCMQSNLFLEKLELIREKNQVLGFKFYLYTDLKTPKAIDPFSCLSLDHETSKFICTAKFGDSCQDIQSSLGAPSRVHYKDEDKMKIHSPGGIKSRIKYGSVYFYNYIQYGVDILFDAKTHSVKKFVLHTNFPGHFNFNLYYRCNFYIPLLINKQRLQSYTDDNEEDSKLIPVTFETKWSSIEKYIISGNSKPVVLNRTSERNPFGSTFCFGIKEFIFEVMNNDHIDSVTVYQLQSKKKIIIISL